MLRLVKLSKDLISLTHSVDLVKVHRCLRHEQHSNELEYRRYSCYTQHPPPLISEGNAHKVRNELSRCDAEHIASNNHASYFDRGSLSQIERNDHCPNPDAKL